MARVSECGLLVTQTDMEKEIAGIVSIEVD